MVFRKQNSSECSVYSREIIDVRKPGKYQSGAELNNNLILYFVFFLTEEVDILTK